MSEQIEGHRRKINWKQLYKFIWIITTLSAVIGACVFLPIGRFATNVEPIRSIRDYDIFGNPIYKYRFPIGDCPIYIVGLVLIAPFVLNVGLHSILIILGVILL